MEKHFYAVIMAGGGGTRLWPLSRKETPKQLLNLTEERSLFRIALDRLNGIFDPGHIFIVSVEEQIEKLSQHAPEIPKDNYLVEPMPRGTASVVGLAAIYLQKIDPEAVMVVLTADHLMKNVDYFQKLLLRAKVAADEGYLVTLGIKPTFPSIGYGYIEAGELLGVLGVYDVKQFKEKPDSETAQKYLESGSYFWNSGMFIWSIRSILDEFEKQMPALFEKLKMIQENFIIKNQIGNITDIWKTIEPETIDYGIMEGASKVVVLPAEDLGWSDVGSWDSLFSILDADQQGNINQINNIVNIESSGNLIRETDDNKMVAVVGVDDLIIVDHENTLLICKKGEGQKIRQIIAKLKKDGLSDYL